MKDRQHGRSIEHGSFLYMGAVVKHRGYGPVYVAERIFLYNNYCDTGGSKIFLCAGINDIIL